MQTYKQMLLSFCLLLFSGFCLSAKQALAFAVETFPERNLKEGNIGVRSIDFVNPDFRQTSPKHTTVVGGRISSPVREEELGLGLDVQGQFVNDYPVLNNFTANEFYFKVNPDWQNSTLYLGRKRQGWSDLDANWQLGVIEPVFKMDPLDITEQGLTGFFIDIKRAGWSLEVFATPFFLPDHGPSVDTRDGEFIKGHPWVTLPPQEVNIFGSMTPAYYNIEKPAAPDIISHNGYALKWMLGREDLHGEPEGFVSQFSMGYLPVNQLSLGFDGAYNISAKNRLEIDIKPQVIYHKILAVDGSFTGESWRFGLSFLQEEPDAPDFDSRWTHQLYHPTTLVSPTVSYRYGHWQTRLSYLRRFGGGAETLGPQADMFKKAIPDRYGFNDLIKTELRWQSETRNSFKTFVAGKWTRETLENSDIISLQMGFQLGPFWQLYSGADLLATENRNKASADLAEVYQRNDRAYGGVQYVF